MSDEVEGIIADALKDRFRKRIEITASSPEKPVTFAQTGVQMPGDQVWLDYANGVIEALIKYGYDAVLHGIMREQEKEE